ncbi:hypothetical protein V7S79_05400 [Aquirufa sp. ROCK-SH2]
MKNNFKTYLKILVAIGLAVFFYKVIFPDFYVGFREGYNQAKKDRSK